MTGLQHPICASAVFAIAVLLLASGCEQTTALHFQTVDASSGAPLGAVHVTRQSYRPDVVRGVRRDAVLPDTDERGELRGAPAIEGWANTFTFRRTGFLDSFVNTNGRTPQHTTIVTQPRPEDFQNSMADPRKPLVVPLFPVTGAATEPSDITPRPRTR